MNYTQQDIQDNMGLVFMVGNGMRFLTRQHRELMEFQDLVSSGIEGLIHALERFEPERGLRFSTYAFQCIKFYMFRGHRQLFGQHWNGSEKGIRYTEVSIYEEDSSELYFKVHDHGMHAEDIFENAHLQRLWDKLDTKLTRHQREVVGLIRQGMNQTEVAERLGVSRQAVHITYHNAVKRAKKCFQQQAA